MKPVTYAVADPNDTFSPSGPYQVYGNTGFTTQKQLFDALYLCNIELVKDLFVAQRLCDKYKAIGFGTANSGESSKVKQQNGTAFIVYGLQNGSVTLSDVLKRLGIASGCTFYARI